MLEMDQILVMQMQLQQTEGTQVYPEWVNAFASSHFNTLEPETMPEGQDVPEFEFKMAGDNEAIWPWREPNSPEQHDTPPSPGPSATSTNQPLMNQADTSDIISISFTFEECLALTSFTSRPCTPSHDAPLSALFPPEDETAAQWGPVQLPEETSSEYDAFAWSPWLGDGNGETDTSSRMYTGSGSPVVETPGHSDSGGWAFEGWLEDGSDMERRDGMGEDFSIPSTTVPRAPRLRTVPLPPV
ncbi:hypothetical protein K474DRAFT_1776463 [Panus rudis PR-1116 ss-1]|nr:hypothetical protein K474DRAFT_1776463 [Panus rudis PR-1116 ss-1]